MMKILLLTLILTSSDTAKVKVPTKALLLSCFTPAGGQFYNEKYIKGAILGSIEIYTGYRAMKNYLSYRRTGSNERFADALSFGFYFLSFWLYSMADAYVDAHLYGFKNKIKIEASFNKSVGQTKLLMKWDTRF
ncbi:MAG: hypothetical protein ABIM20_01715 [candidate division WOR-3 bacterium]